MLPLIIPDENFRECKKIPELPDEKKQRYINELGIKESDAEVLISEYEMALYFEDLIRAGHEPKLCVT